MDRHRDQLPRLSIPPPLNVQHSMGYDRGPPIYSPALQTAYQQNFHPQFPMNNSMQTPIQNYFTHQPPPAPGRPSHLSHHTGHASIAHLAAAGIHPPHGFPMTPVSGHFSRPSMMLGHGPPFGGQPSGQPFPNRNRRQLSIGGPPKAVLGGPARKLSPLPVIAVVPSPVAAPKAKKIAVNLPKETMREDDGQSVTRPTWARTPLDNLFIPRDVDVAPVEISSAESYPPDTSRNLIPNTIEVFLPGKCEWEKIKQQVIEEKLERLGVGSGSNMPHIHAPHARAASISSPADPALLLFKLNKLQQSQEAEMADSLSTSPQPPFGLSPSPHRPLPRFITNRHGHSMSLAQPPTYQPSFFDATVAAFNPFGPNAILGSDEPVHRASPHPIPVPLESSHPSQSQFSEPFTPIAPLSAVGVDIRPDFTRGFGLDIPEEKEEEEANEYTGVTEDAAANANYVEANVSQDTEPNDVEDAVQQVNEAGPFLESHHHSRHVSKLSAALTLRSVGGLVDDLADTSMDIEPTRGGIQIIDDGREDLDIEDVAGEWTGSEDQYLGTDGSDRDSSIGEWSNPSDEERARQDRVERRMRRRALQQVDEKPRRLPNFPRPPENTIILPVPRDDDLISNPSDEENIPLSHSGEYLGVEHADYYSRPPSDLSGRSGRPLPPLPHSRAPSAQLSAHDPAHAHSRVPSDTFVYPGNQHQRQSSYGSLNPLAKPFVFGARSGSSASWEPAAPSSAVQMPMAPLMGHSRLPSIGKPLNVAAPEFKPTGFTFRPPAGVPQMPLALPTPDIARPLPEPPAHSSPFKVQGREKRQRRGSSASMEEGDSMSSFRFPPNVESPQSIRRIASPQPPALHTHKSLNPSAEPFTFAGFSAVASLPHVPHESDAPAAPTHNLGSPEETLHDESTAKVENDDTQSDGFQLPSSSKQKRAPIPLDFKHPVSSNTVPAGLFKALVNGGDERTRRTVRSRLSSREIFEHVHRPSMDDIDVPQIARKVSRSRLVTDPGNRQLSLSPNEDVFVSVRHTRRRSSLPEALHSSSVSDNSIPPMDLTGKMEMLQFEQRLDALIEDKFSVFFNQLSKKETNIGQSMDSSTQAMLTDVVSLFRAQLQDSARRGLEDSQMDARGEMDFQLLKDVVEQGHSDLLSLFKRELDDTTHRLRKAITSGESSQIVVPVIEEVGARTVRAVIESISELTVRLEAIGRVNSSRERESIVEMLMMSLGPSLAALRTEPIDYDFLTSELSQAVKPHISQLIDLASDKRETASLIVDRIMPLLPSMQAPALDTDAITLQLITEVRRAIAPIDAFEIKEQVADLVVERLDSRLAVRDKAFNVETVTSQVTDSISHLLKPMERVETTLGKLISGQEALSAQQTDVHSGHDLIKDIVTELSEKLLESMEALRAAQTDLVSLSTEPSSTKSDENVLAIKSVVEDLSGGQKALAASSEEILSVHKDIVERLKTLPDSLTTAAGVLQASHADLMSGRDSSKREMDDLRKLNTEYQIQVTKARGSHGQIRVEKDVLSEKLAVAEADRDRLRSQVKELQVTATSKTTEAATLESRNAELEDALAKALARLQASDVATQANQERIASLEKTSDELTSEKQTLKSKVDSLSLQVTFAERDKDATVQVLDVLQKQHDAALLQQSHWAELREASEKIDRLTSLIGQADNEELKELRRLRERSKNLETEHAALQKRFKEQETRFANNERSAAASRQSLIQAQQRSSEWERRAKEYEGELELTRTKLDQTEQTQTQLEADYSLIALQLEERDADDRLAKNQENKMRDQIADLQNKVTRLQTELDEAKAETTPTNVVPSSSPFRKPVNGSAHAPRPDSRASTIYGDRSVTPNMRINSQTSTARSDTPPQASVWDSMHAPTAASIHAPSVASVRASMHAPSNTAKPSRYPNIGPSTPKARRAPAFYRPSMPSPTPSTVSLAPTQGDDGWWS